MWFFSNARLCGLLDWSVYDCSGVFGVAWCFPLVCVILVWVVWWFDALGFSRVGCVLSVCG